MKMTGGERLKKLQDANLPSRIIEIAFSKNVPVLLKDYCRTLKYYYEKDVMMPNFYFVPLWEGHSSITAYRESGKGIEFFKFHVETPEKIEIIGKSISAVMANLLIWLWAEVEVDDSDIINLSVEVGFPGVANLLDELKVANQGGYADRCKWEKKYLENL